MNHPNSAKRKPAIEGTTRALPANMYDADSIEAINVEQLVTPTDRMLLRGRARRRRPSTAPLAPNGRGSYPVVVPPTPAAAPQIAAPTLAAPRFATRMPVVAPRLTTLRVAAHTPAQARMTAPRIAAHAPTLASRLAAHTPSLSPARDLYRQMMSAPTLARGSQPQLAAPHGEPTLQIRAQPSSVRAQVFAVTVVIPTLVGIAVGLAALL